MEDQDLMDLLRGSYRMLQTKISLVYNWLNDSKAV